MNTATHESLFIKKLDQNEIFQKIAGIARMPDDDKKWPEVVLSELHKQLPFMSGMDVSLNFTRIQPEAGYGFGYALVRGQKNAIAIGPKDENQMVKIPLIIEDRELEPFHVFHFEGKTVPLTKGRFEEALENPRMFAGSDDIPNTQKSLIDQLYPPYQQRQGFGRVVDGSGMSGSSMGINKVAQAVTNVINPLSAESITHVPAYGLAGGAAGAGIGKLVGGNRGAAIGGAIGAGMGILKGSINQHKVRKNNINTMLENAKATMAARNEQNKVATGIEGMDPRQIARLATLKQYENIDRANAGMQQKDKINNAIDNTSFSMGTGALMGGIKHIAANKASPITAKGLGVASAKGALTGAGLSLLGQGYRAFKAKRRAADRASAPYAEHFKQAEIADIPAYRPAESEDIMCRNCKYYGSSTETGVGVCNKFTADVSENMLCDDWEATGTTDKLASYNKFLMGARK